MLGGRPSPELDHLATELDGASTFAVELTDYDEVAAAVEAINELDVLVHNAGVGSSSNTSRTPPSRNGITYSR